MLRNLIEPVPTAAGSKFKVEVQRFGRPGNGPKAYIQAGLHAEEAPGIAVALELSRLLADLDSQQKVLGEIVLVPFANPIGREQYLFGTHLGRFDLASGQNFNRHFCDAAAVTLADNALPPAGDNTSIIAALRRRMHEAIAAQPATTPLETLQNHLLALAIDSDIVLDLHCDSEAVAHLYCHSAQCAEAEQLGAHLRAAAILHAELQGGQSFEEACTLPWVRFREAWPNIAIPMACFAATVEFRGVHDVDRQQAFVDATHIVDYLRARRVIAASGETHVTGVKATPLAAVEVIHAPRAGIVSYPTPIGAKVAAGDLVAQINDPEGGWIDLHASTGGILYARERSRLVRQHAEIAFIAGETPLRSGMLLSA